MRAAAVGLALGVLLASCSSESSSDAFTVENAVECRELGGGWVYVRYERGGESMTGTHHGLGEFGDLDLESGISDDELEAAIQLRDAAGWNEAALMELQQPDVPAKTKARLAQMPSCLDELRVNELSW